MKLFIPLLLLAGSLVCGQTRPPSMPENTANLPAQPIGARDLIMVQVYDSPELSRSIRVGADGWIRLPMLKQKVKAEGLMPHELETAVAKTLDDEQLIVDPMVIVTVAEYASRPVSVAGSVRTPLTFQASSPVTLLEAIARAGGLTNDAGPEILISRPQPHGADGPPAIQRVPVKALIDAADPGANIQLTGGEELRVPEAGKIFVVGNVKRPGAFAVQDGENSTLMKMLALAEGLLPFAGKQAYVLRRDASGSKNEIPVELQRILQRKAPDTELQVNDILYIPDNHGRRLGVAALERLLMLSGTAGANALVFGR